MPSIYDLDTSLEAFIKAQLTANSELVTLVGINTETNEPQVYYLQAPQDGVPGGSGDFDNPPPYVVFQNQSGFINTVAIGEIMVWGECLALVKVTGLVGAVDVIRRVNKLIQELLEDTRGTTSDGYVVDCVIDETPFTPYNETVDGVIYHTRGTIYRVIVQANP